MSISTVVVPLATELSIAGPRGGERRIVYCGHTRKEQVRTMNLRRDGSHLAQIIRSVPQWLISGGKSQRRIAVRIAHADFGVWEPKAINLGQ